MSISLSALETRFQTAIGDSEGTYADDYADAINNAIREVYPNLYKAVDDVTKTGVADTYEYQLPTELQAGNLRDVWVQLTTDDDKTTDRYRRVFGWQVIDEAGTKYLKMPYIPATDQIIRLIGITLLEELTTDESTITLDDKRVNLLIAYAAHLLFEMESSTPASEDVSRYERLSAMWLGKYYRLLPQLRMMPPPKPINRSLA